MSIRKPGLHRVFAASAAIAFVLATSCAAAFGQDLEADKKQFVTSCGTCHVVDPAAGKRQGPPLNGIIGRKSGSVAGFAYSPALAAANLTFDEATLDKWITNAQALVPGSRMPYRQADPDKRGKIIAYLKSVSPAN
jgi:cytochrome c